MLMPRTISRRLFGAIVLFLLPIHAHAELKGTNATFYSWDDDPGTLAFKNSNSSVILDGKWHPFFAALNFDSTTVDPAAVDQSNGAVQCSATDTDGNGLVGTTTQWAGTLQLSVDHIDTGTSPVINGFQETRCWELAICDRETDGTNDFAGSDLSANPRYRRFAIDVTGQGSCPTPNQNTSFGYVDPVDTNGFITLLSKDIVNPCSQSGRCDSKIDTNLYIILDRDCDGFIDDNDGAQVNNDPAEGDLTLIGSGGAGRIPLAVGNNDPDVCFYAEGKKPDFTRNPQWGGNIQARITAPAGSSGEKTVNHSIIASPVAGDVGDLPAGFEAAPHVTNAFPNPNPFLGGAPDNDAALLSSSLADGDDVDGTLPSDEDGVVLPTDSTADGDGSAIVYTATATATNNSGLPAQLCGWFDMNQDQVLDNGANTSTTSSDPDFASRSDAGERSCVLVPTGTTDGSFPIAWTIPLSARENTGNFFLRFRISFDEDMFDSFVISPSDGLNSGEVEDYLLEGVSTLPVSIASFLATPTKSGLTVEWLTASETHNLGFDIWAVTDSGLEKLNAEMIPARDDGDVLTPREYRVVLNGVDAGRIRELAITATDYNGKQDMYGLFEVGSRYGEQVHADSIPWAQVRAEVSQRQSLRRSGSNPGRGRAPSAPGQLKSASIVTRGQPLEAVYGDVRVSAAGMQRVTHAQLAAAGMDLAGTPADQIAVTLKGEPVARDLVNERGVRLRGNAPFGPGDEIRFWGELPRQPDALYLDAYTYRIEANRAMAVQAGRLNGRPGAATGIYAHVLRQDDELRYHLASPLDDPWYAAMLRADRDNSYTTQFDIDGDLISDQPGRIRIQVGGLTRYRASPDHHAEVEINGEVVGDLYFDGQMAATIEASVRAGLLIPGTNSVTVRATGRTDAPFDLFLVDSVELTYPRRTRASDERILVERGIEPSAGLQVSGFGGGDVAAYAWDGAALTALKTSARGDSVNVATTDAEAAYWLSTAAAMHAPEIAGIGQREDLFANRGPADLIVIAHPAFVPVSADEPHPLNDYITQRQREGWNVGLFDVSRIQAEYAGGMALPEAVTAFLRDADARFAYEHVLLVGGDSYDYTDNLGMGSISYIPTRYTPTHSIPHTPSDALLVDFNGDRLADKAVGRWPVRTQGDLAAIVAKTLDWPNVANEKGIVWVTDSEDSRSGSFTAQADRMIDIASDAGWGERASRLYWGEVPGAPGQSAPAAARDALFDALESGQALTGFVGHGSPFMWTFQGLLRPDDLRDLFNDGKPTMINTLTCYTSYFVSPTGDSVAHRWMNGYRLDAGGQPIPGVANGAAALHGAGTFSNYGDNEIFAGTVLREQFAGKTVGQAIQAARVEARERVMADLMVNWILLGDPTLRLEN